MTTTSTAIAATTVSARTTDDFFSSVENLRGFELDFSSAKTSIYLPRSVLIFDNIYTVIPKSEDNFFQIGFTANERSDVAKQ